MLPQQSFKDRTASEIEKSGAPDVEIIKVKVDVGAETSRIEKLKKLIKNESTHFNLKTLFALTMVMIVFLCSLFRGNGKKPSVVGVTKCQPFDHVLLVALIMSGILFTVGAAFWVRKDYVYKKQIGY